MILFHEAQAASFDSDRDYLDGRRDQRDERFGIPSAVAAEHHNLIVTLFISYFS
jgi:hypothetical protein